MAKFPSVKWFNEVRKIYNGDEAYRGGGGGQCNCVAGMKIGKEVFVLTFEGFECSVAEKANQAALEDVDFFLEMSPSLWRAMLQNIKDNDHATLDYTLNTLDLGRDEGLSTSMHGDQYREDLFFRYNQTFQYFFDASARIKTEFA